MDPRQQQALQALYAAQADSYQAAQQTLDAVRLQPSAPQPTDGGLPPPLGAPHHFAAAPPSPLPQNQQQQQQQQRQQQRQHAGQPCPPDGRNLKSNSTALGGSSPAQPDDPAVLALQLRHRMRLAGGTSERQQQQQPGRPEAAEPPLGWVADVELFPQRLDEWVEQVEALHQVGAVVDGVQVRDGEMTAEALVVTFVRPNLQGDASAAELAASAPPLPDLEALMQAWTPEQLALMSGSPLPDPRQASPPHCSTGPGCC